MGGKYFVNRLTDYFSLSILPEYSLSKCQMVITYPVNYWSREMKHGLMSVPKSRSIDWAITYLNAQNPWPWEWLIYHIGWRKWKSCYRKYPAWPNFSPGLGAVRIHLVQWTSVVIGEFKDSIESLEAQRENRLWNSRRPTVINWVAYV